MSKKKTNPKYKPATQADVKRAIIKATDDAMERMLYIVLYALVDKHEVTKDEVKQINADVNYIVDSINSGYLSWRDIDAVLEDEYDVHLDFR